MKHKGRLDRHFVLEVYRLMTERRGSRVALDRAIERTHKYLGFTSEEAHARLVSPPDAWTVRLHWSGKEAGGVDPVRWFATKAAALNELVETVDQYRLYPDAIEALTGGGVGIKKAGEMILEASPMAWHQVDDRKAAQVRSWLREDDESRIELLRRLEELQQLEHHDGPLVEVISEFGVQGHREGQAKFALSRFSSVQEQGRLLWEVDTLDAQLEALFKRQRINLTRDEASAEMARLLGFKEWEDVIEAYKRATVLDPYVVHDPEHHTHLICRDVAEAIVAFADRCAVRKKGLHWQYHEYAGGLEMALVRDPCQREEKQRLVWLESMEESGRNRRTSNVKQWPDADEGCARLLSEMLRVEAPGRERIEASDRRREASSMEVGRAHVASRKDWFGTEDDHLPSARVTVEYLRTKDGWRDLESEKRAELSFYLNSYPDETCGVALSTRGGVSLGRAGWKGGKTKRLEYWGCAKLLDATAKEGERLASFLEMKEIEGEVGVFTDQRVEEAHERRMRRPLDMQESMRSMVEYELRYQPPWKVAKTEA